jgi:hypothetical protein
MRLRQNSAPRRPARPFERRSPPRATLSRMRLALDKIDTVTDLIRDIEMLEG